MPSPTPDPEARFIIPSQEWEYFTPQTLAELRNAEPVDNPVDSDNGP